MTTHSVSLDEYPFLKSLTRHIVHLNCFFIFMQIFKYVFLGNAASRNFSPFSTTSCGHWYKSLKMSFTYVYSHQEPNDTPECVAPQAPTSVICGKTSLLMKAINPLPFRLQLSFGKQLGWVEITSLFDFKFV